MSEYKYEHIVYVILAIFGGIARYLNGYFHGRTFHWAKLWAAVFVSGFSGYMFAQVCLLIKPAWANIAAGMGGFMGGTAITFLIEVFLSKVKLKGKNEE